MTIVVHYVRCESCMWAQREKDHPDGPHSWKGVDDLNHAKEPIPATPEEWAALAESSPCNCWCNGRTPVEYVESVVTK